MNILNLLIIVYILGMAYWWGSQGVFSALIHLVAVIVSGALALALWETLTLKLMMGISPTYSWTAGLLTPFLLFLLILRLVSDRYLGSNVSFSQVINMIVGGALGVLSAIFTAGILILGISFLPVSPSLAGYQPLLVEENGDISGKAGKGLFIPVDTITASFYTTLSSGAFTSGKPMRVYQPELATQAALYRMAYDPYASPVADPKYVSVSAMITAPTPLKVVDDSTITLLGPKARVTGHKLLILDTLWKQLPGMYDGDSTLRVSPTQIRLVFTDENGDTALMSPIAASALSGTQRRFVPFNDNRTYVWGDGEEISLAFMFMLAENQRPRFLMVRHARLEIPAEDTGQPEDALELAGQSSTNQILLSDTPTDGSDPTALDRTGPETGQAVLNLGLDDKIPDQISKNVIQSYIADDTGLVKFSGTARKVTSSITKEVLIDHIHTPTHRRTIRVQLDREQANGVFGAARVAAAQVGGIWLEDHLGDKWYPVAYVLRQNTGNQKIHVDLGQPMQSAKELPLAEIQPGEAFYLYFSVSKGVRIISYNVGSQSTVVDLNVPN